MKNFSFYKFVRLERDFPFLRRRLLEDFSGLRVRGRIYLAASEGINAYVSVPSDRLDEFRDALTLAIPETKNVLFNDTIGDGGEGRFSHLHVRWRRRLVVAGEDKEPSLDRLIQGPHEPGKKIGAAEWNSLLGTEGTVLVDARNGFEREVGRMEVESDAGKKSTTFRQQVQQVIEELREKKAESKEILMFCTSGIRCEKLSVILQDEGFPRVTQLRGGVTEYVREAREKNLPVKFRGKLFSFDEQMGQQISGDHLGRCYNCGAATSGNQNCSYKHCHKLTVQCDDCHKALHGACCPQHTDLLKQEKKT